ncbi:MAG: ABC transporter ATP-binding protein [bacterium]|nr:ABC transporter ATP-binding protein [bacterium]
MLLTLGVLTSIADGISISLLIPLLMTLFGSGALTQSDNGILGSILGRFAEIGGAENKLYVIAGTIVIMIMIRAILSYWDNKLVQLVSGRISHEIRAKIHANLLAVDYHFIQANDNGRLLNTLEAEAWRTTEAITSIFALFTSICMIFAFGTLLLLISFKLTVMTALLVAGVSLLRRILDKRVRRLSTQALDAAEILSVRACEVFDSMRMIRAFGREDHSQRMYEEASRNVLDIEMKMSALSGKASAMHEILYALIFAALILTAMHISVNQASIIAFLALLHRMQPHVKSIDETRTHLIAVSGSIAAVTRLLDLEPWSGHGQGTRKLEGLRDSIRFENVSFSYEGKDAEERNAIENVTLEIPFGKTTAIVGPSGAGKTTLTNLLFRFHDPDSGTILVDGVPLDRLDLGWWRSQLAVAGQDADLISGSLRDNIAYARPDASDEEIETVARAANIHDFIVSLPKGYATQIGTRGLLLSGGQRQRIELARAMMSQGGLLILDEATNALDSMTESEVLNSLQLLHGQRTIIVIAHRLSTTRMADWVIVMAQGNVAERGSPTDLYRSDGIFRKMVHMQELSYIVNDRAIAEQSPSDSQVDLA